VIQGTLSHLLLCEPTSNVHSNSQNGDSVAYISQAITFGKRVLMEGANALMPGLDFGTYTATTVSVL